MSREKTVEEVRSDFLNHIKIMISCWDNLSNKTTKEKLEGLAFSILVALDGEAGILPAFIVAPFPHPDDKQFNIDENENYYPENDDAKINCDIAGSLHEYFAKEEF